MEPQNKVLLCPVCRKPLSEVVSHGLSVSRCYNCKGFLVDPGKTNHPNLCDFAESKKSKSILQKSSQGQELLCPHDGSKMNPLKVPGFPNLTVPVCLECRRTWFDAKRLFDKTQKMEKKTSTGLKYFFLTFFIPALFFFEYYSLGWLPQHCPSETLKFSCIFSVIFAIFCLCCIRLSGEAYEGGGGEFESAAMIALPVASSLSKKTWKTLSLLSFFAAIVFFMAWSQHTERKKNLSENLPVQAVRPSRIHNGGH